MNELRTKEELLGLLRPWGQEHLLRFWDSLAPSGRERLAAQIRAIDWPVFHEWIRKYVIQKPVTEIPADLAPAPYYPLKPRDREQAAVYRAAVQTGEELLRAGKVAGFTVAGGQGTRLGFAGPKGTFPIGVVSGKSLFQLFAEGILRAGEKYGRPLFWYIMTSPVNDSATRRFFDENDYFGLSREQVRFFPQGVLPAVGFDGRLILAEPDSLALSPNGHGGSLLALRDSGALREMAKHGVEHISYWQVDNPLVTGFDPLFIGLHARTGSDMSSRCLTKTGPFEKLGNFCITGGRLKIIEYSDMPEELATAVDAGGRLRFRAGSPAIHVIRRDFIERITGGGLHLPVHRAEKKVDFVDENGQLVHPERPNAVKLEMFIFDALPLARNPLVLEADREEQFAPVKNRVGVDSVVTSQALLLARALRWLEAAGVAVPRTADGTPLCRVELSPRRFLAPEDVREQASSLPAPGPGEVKVYE